MWSVPLRVFCPGPLLRLACLGGGGPVPVPPYLAWGCGSGGRASPGRAPSTVTRGVWGQSLPLPRLPAHWAGCWGPLPTCYVPLACMPCGGWVPRGRWGAVPLPGLGLCAPRGAGLWRSCAGRRAGGGGRTVRRAPRLCGRGGPVGRGVALPPSVPLPSLGRQQSGCHWRRSVHGGRGPPYHSGSCSPAFTGRDLCGVLARWRGLTCEAGSDPRGHLGVTWGVYLCAGKPPLADIILSHPPDLTGCDSVIGLAIPAMSGHIQYRGTASGDLYIGISGINRVLLS